MAVSLGGVLVVLGIFIRSCQADFGLNATVPNLRTSVSAAIGSGVDPLLAANRSITVDVAADVTEILAALVTVTNSVNASVSKIFTATQDVVTDDNTARVQLFGKLCKALQEANDVNSIASAMDVFVQNLDSTTNSAISANMTNLKYHKNTLNSVFRTISNGVKAAEAAEAPVTNANVGNFITPAMVTSLADGLSSITTCVNNIADLFTKVIDNQMNAAAQVAKVNASANTAVRSLATTFNTFSSNTVESCRIAVQTEKSATSNIIASFSPILDNSDSFNGGDVSNLNSYIETLKQLNKTYAQTVMSNYETVQARVFEMLTTQTQLVAVTLYNATKSIIYADAPSMSEHVSTCTAKYIGQLMAPPVQVSRLSSCLSPETDTLLNYDPMLAPLMLQLQTDASAISSVRMLSCTRSNGQCSSVYFSAYDGLAVQVEAQLKNLNTVLGNELKFLQSRVETCVTAITADINDNIHTIQTNFLNCLTTGQ
ncbi:uncharacterized protein LOC135703545 [Ochlerotatus camptorhynchus]|uniref:uncharacterized protein LOC135703545 n=1 Tax=Ochlerotatus camptorhynchus TaxID=644619 RepID=UPI0031D3F56B